MCLEEPLDAARGELARLRQQIADLATGEADFLDFVKQGTAELNAKADSYEERLRQAALHVERGQERVDSLRQVSHGRCAVCFVSPCVFASVSWFSLIDHTICAHVCHVSAPSLAACLRFFFDFFIRKRSHHPRVAGLGGAAPYVVCHISTAWSTGALVWCTPCAR